LVEEDTIPNRNKIITDYSLQIHSSELQMVMLQGSHQEYTVPDIRPDNPAFYTVFATGWRSDFAGLMYPAGYRLLRIAGNPAGYPADA
jgi:hypothetical protein